MMFIAVKRSYGTYTKRSSIKEEPELKMKNYSPAEMNTISTIDAIRKRPAMYVGKINNKGVLSLIKGIISIFISNALSNSIILTIDGARLAQLEFKNMKDGIIDSCATHYTYSINNRFVDLAVLNALCKKVEINYLGSNFKEVSVQTFERGELKSGSIKNLPQKCSSFLIKFELDELIWSDEFSIQTNYISHEIRELAYLNKEINFVVNHEVDNDKSKVIYKFKNGLQDKIQIEILNRLGQIYLETVIEKELDGVHIDIAFAFKGYSVDKSYLVSYVNEIYTCDNGTHVDGLIQGIKAGIFKYFEKSQLKSNYIISEDKIADNLIAAIHVKVDSPIFGGSVTNKLANLEIIKPICDLVSKVVQDKIGSDEEIRKRILKLFRE